MGQQEVSDEYDGGPSLVIAPYLMIYGLMVVRRSECFKRTEIH
jgi:hypothetical protein